MAHELTDRDGLFTVRRPAWHGLGTVLSDYPSREEAKELALPWEPIVEPLYRIVRVPKHIGTDDHTGHFETCTPEENPSHFEGTKVKAVRVSEFDLVTRDDDPSLILGVKPETRSLVRNEELFDIGEALMKGEGDGRVLYETGGSLQGGRRVWLLLRFSEPLVIGGRNGTETVPFYALQNAHDGSGSFRGQATEVCIVCSNTSKMADLDASVKGTEFVFRHTARISERIEEAKNALQGWKHSVSEFQRLADHMIDIPVTKEQRAEFVREFIPLPQETLISERVRDNVIQARTQMLSIFDGPTQEVTRDTVWGLVQGALEYQQWYRRARSDESRFQRAYLDRSRLTTDAVQLALAVSQ